MQDSLRSRLHKIFSKFQEDSVSTSGQSDAAIDTTNTNASTNPTTNSSQSGIDIIYRNPHTILSLDPQQLSSMLNVSLEAVDRLRILAANAIAEDATRNESMMSMSSSSKSFLAGGFTLLQAHESFQNTIMLPEHRTQAISTGSLALDRLVDPSSSNHAQRKRMRSEDNHGSNPFDSTDVASLNGMGIPYSRITQVSGPSACGKTQLALTLAVNAINGIHTDANGMAKSATSNYCTVHYIASGGGSAGLVPFARRLRQIVGELDKQGKIQIPRERVLECVRFDCVRDGYELLALLSQLENEFRVNKGYASNMLLVVDSISSCLAPLLYGEGDGGVGAALLNEVHLALRRISRLVIETKRIGIFITNGMVSDQKRGRKPALGEMWRAADFHIVLEAGRDISVISEQNLERVTLRSIRARVENGCNIDDTANGGIVEFGIGAPGIVDLNGQ
jgi:RecA/RadA recombinase